MNPSHSPRGIVRRLRSATATLLGISIAALSAQKAFPEQPPAPRHLYPSATTDQNTVENRGDVVNLPAHSRTGLVGLRIAHIAYFRCRCSRRRTTRANCFSTTFWTPTVSNQTFSLHCFRASMIMCN